MDDLIKNVVTSLGTTGIALVLAFWWLRTYLDRTLAARFAAQETRMKGEAEISVSLRRMRLSRTAEMLPELQRLISEARLVLREAIQDLSEEGSSKLADKYEQLVDLLYNAQLFLLPATYEAIHSFKNVIHGSCIIVSNPRQHGGKLKARGILDGQREKLETDYQRIGDALRAEMQRLESLGRSE